MRYLLFGRDKGICAICQADTHAQSVEFHKLPRGAVDSPEEKRRDEFLQTHGVPWSRSSGRGWWDADHITPVIEGGGECRINNFRTLCLPCHRTETKKLHERLSVVRKKERVIKKDSSRTLFAGIDADTQVD